MVASPVGALMFGTIELLLLAVFVLVVITAAGLILVGFLRATAGRVPGQDD